MAKRIDKALKGKPFSEKEQKQIKEALRRAMVALTNLRELRGELPPTSKSIH